MKQLFLFLFTALSLGATAQQAPRCEILSMEHFGGNEGDYLGPPTAIVHPDGTFSIGVSTNSTSGSINLGCVTPAFGRYFFRTYTSDYSTLLGETCFPEGSNFNWPTYLVFPQGNGDTILIGTYKDAFDLFDVVIERRHGNVLWNKIYGGSNHDPQGRVIQTRDGGFLCTTVSFSNDGDVGLHYGNPLESDVWLLRLDTGGNKLWSRVLGGSEYDFIRTTIEAADGSFYLFGGTTSTDYDATSNKGGADLWVVKLDSAGNTLWHKCLGGSGNDGAAYDQGVFAVTDGGSGFYVLNRTASQDGDVQQRKLPYSPEEDPDYWLLHIDSAANIIWETTFGTTGWQVPTGFCRGADGSLWCMGKLSGGLLAPDSNILDVYGDNDGWVVHTDTLGQQINQRTIGADKDERVDFIHPLPDGSVLIGGNYYHTFTPGSGNPGFPAFNEGFEDVFIARLGPNSVGIDDTGSRDLAWQVYPNPAGEEIMVEIGDPDAYKGLRLGITDAQGREVYTAMVKGKVTRINCKAFAGGAYVVRLSDAKGSLGVKKVVIRH